MSLPRVDTMRPTSPLAAWVPIGLGAFVVLGIALNVSNPPGLLAFVPYAVVGSLLVARRPHNVIGWLLVVMAIAFSLVGRGLDVAAAVYGTPWAPWLPIFAWVVLGAILVCTVGLVFRFRTAGTIERQQDKWFLASLAALISAISFGFVGASFTGGNDAWVWFPALSSFPLPAIAIGIAITRYRLYDIDRVISRTIAYAGVTVVLFAVFAIVNVVSPIGAGTGRRWRICRRCGVNVGHRGVVQPASNSPAAARRPSLQPGSPGCGTDRGSFRRAPPRSARPWLDRARVD